MKLKNIFIGLVALLGFSCDYLDVVPDNIATLEMAFNTRTNAERYLATCYNYVPCMSDLNTNSGLISGGEMWYLMQSSHYYNNTTSFSVARGMQNTNDPLLNFWSGGNGGYNLFRGIHECNTFLANIDRVPDMSQIEKNKWRAEVQTLKAYYLYFLMLHYGPIPILDKNVAVDAELSSMHLERQPIDVVVDYIVNLLDEAIKSRALPLNVVSTQSDLGRITIPIAKAIKAKTLVLAASPLFNGNEMYKGFVNAEGKHFINQTYSQKKWEDAAAACLEAIESAHEAGFKLYTFQERLNYDPKPETLQELSLRNVITSRFNEETIWALGDNGTTSIQDLAHPHLDGYSQGFYMYRSQSQLNPPLNIVEQFYSENGVPIDEDKNYDYANRYELTTTPNDPSRFCNNYTTVKLHLNREPRFYAYIGFDGGRWFSMQSCSADDSNPIEFKTKKGDYAGAMDVIYSSTGYFTKKLISYQNVNTEQTQVNYSYSFPIIRLADLYLLYAEALNQVKDAPDAEVYEYIQLVRNRAGLDNGGSLVDTWATYSTNPEKPTTKSGMAEIIRQERMNELAFEGHRYHDIRRWKLGAELLGTPIEGWSVLESEAEYYYQDRTIFKRTFMPRDYLWPIKIDDLNRNPKLIQNPQW